MESKKIKHCRMPLNRTNLIKHILKNNSQFGLLKPRFTSKIAIEVNQDVITKLEKEEIKPRHHPGICKAGSLALPKYYVNAIIRASGDYPPKTLIKEAERLNRYLKARHPPHEQNEIRQKISEIERELDTKFPLPNIKESSDEELEHLTKLRQSRVNRILKQRLIAWKQINYDQFQSLVYAIGRAAPEYAIIIKILTEIQNRDPTFKPRSYFDFGSGIGSGMWAASTLWKDTIFEYYNVDSSKNMNELSDLLLREGKENYTMSLKNVFYRQFLPAKEETKYDIVLSAFSLFELPNAKKRLDVLEKLWHKCDRYLIIIEHGTRTGFQLINEARDFLLNMTNNGLNGYVFAPCPHNFPCPRIRNEEDRTPCNFDIKYEPLQLGEHFEKRTEYYSYLVFKKEPEDSKSECDQWPRIVRQTLVRSKHSICRTCTSDGKLQEIIFTAAKHGKYTYRCARSSSWGDRLPIRIGSTNLNKGEDDKC